jgi:hypothetical protein
MPISSQHKNGKLTDKFSSSYHNYFLGYTAGLVQKQRFLQSIDMLDSDDDVDDQVLEHIYLNNKSMFKFENKIFVKSQIRPKNVPKLMIEYMTDNGSEDSSEFETESGEAVASIRSYSDAELQKVKSKINGN